MNNKIDNGRNHRFIISIAVTIFIGFIGILVSVVSTFQIFIKNKILREDIFFGQIFANIPFMVTFSIFILACVLIVIFLIIKIIRIRREAEESRSVLMTMSSLIVLVIIILSAASVYFTIGFTAGGFIDRIEEIEIYERSNLYVKDFYDFESVEEDNIENSYWKSIPFGKKDYILSISDEFGHNSEKSLKLFGSAEGYKWNDSEKKENYFGIIFWDYKNMIPIETTIKAVSVWILIPPDLSEEFEDNNFYSHIGIYKPYKGTDDSISSLQVFSKDIVLVPGKWTPIFVGTESIVNVFKTEDNYEEVIDNSGISTDGLNITIWVGEEKSYTGSIYFDDICIYD